MSSSSPLKMIILAGLILAAFSAARAALPDGGPQAPAGLRLEYLVDPLGVDVKLPRFFWTPRFEGRGQKQTAFQILMSAMPACAQGDIWDSGKTVSPEFTQVVYGGPALQSGKSYYWKVRAWDKDGQAGPWSVAARFDMGLLGPADWKGSWIGGANQLRREFTVPGRVVRARAYISGLGYHELRVNGRKAGRAVLDPGWTTFDKRVLYVTYDISSLLQEGGNAIGVLLGQGWFKSRALLAQINIELAGGGTISVVSDATWAAADGPIVMDSIYNGETYDARRETPGWDRAGFAGDGWKPAAAVPAPKGVLSAQMMPAIQVLDTIVPFKMSNPEPAAYVFDMGQNFSGWVRLRVSGPRGTAVRLRFAEMLYDNGMINQENLRGARVEDVYILKGEGEEIYEPRFTYHGFRFVEVSGFPGVPAADSIRGRVVHSGVAQTGSFACSKAILNALQRIVTWGQKTNLHSVPTDCDQRDERQGWMGDAQGTAEEAILNFDMAAFYTNFLRDIRDVQDEKGQITDTVPHVWGSRPADPAWGTAYPLIAWYMYRYYGDTRILAEHYDGLKAYVDFLRGKAENELVRYSYYGDWVAVDKTPGSLVSAFYYYYDVRVLSDAARILKKDAEAKAYAALGDGIRKAFNTEFFDPKTGNYANGSQTANALPLFADLATPVERGGAWGNLFDNIAYKNASHLTTGIIGTKYIMEVLNRQGNADLAYDIACQTTYPSWGYMIENGATTLWELWQKREGPSMNSHNHPMFGSVGSWLYKTLAGINLDEQVPGFEKLRIAPAMVRDLMFAAGSIESVRGRIVCSWKRTPKSVTLEAEIPCGSEAEIVIPSFNLVSLVLKEGGTTLWASGKPAAAAAGVLSIEEKTPEKLVLIKVGSGRYLFELTGD